MKMKKYNILFSLSYLSVLFSRSCSFFLVFIILVSCYYDYYCYYHRRCYDDYDFTLLLYFCCRVFIATVQLQKKHNILLFIQTSGQVVID